jgi:hypothetical protein
LGKRLAMLWLPCALVCSMMLPGPVAAASGFRVTLVRDTCVSGAGKYGYGQGVLTVRIVELRRSGANRFTFVGQVWHRRLRGTIWHKEYQWQRRETTFPDNRSSYWTMRRFAYAPDHNAYHRLAVRVRAWHDSKLLFSRSIVGKKC